jgi:hypothetical protein
MVFVLYALSLLILYAVIRTAVKHGILDAQRERDAATTRRRLAETLNRLPNDPT